MSEERCAACPSGLEYATEGQLLGVILSHHALQAARDTEIAKLRAERDAARAEARQLRLEKAESALCDFHEPDETDCEDCQEARTEARRTLEEGKP